MQINDKQTKDNINNNTKFKCPGAIPSDPPERLPRRGGGGFAAGIRQGSPVSLLSPSCLPPVSLLSPSCLPPISLLPEGLSTLPPRWKEYRTRYWDVSGLRLTLRQVRQIAFDEYAVKENEHK